MTRGAVQCYMQPGREGRIGTCTCVTESLRCSLEINTTLLIGSTPM